MKTYRRNLGLILLLLRILFIISVFGVYWLITTSHSDYGLVLLFLVLCGAIFPITELEIDPGLLTIRQFYAYGLFARRWTFLGSDKVRLQPFDRVLSDTGPIHTDDWYDAFLLFVPAAEVKISKFVLKYLKPSGETGQIKLKLKPGEIELLKANLAVEQPSSTSSFPNQDGGA